jgi:hypothetical protein
MAGRKGQARRLDKLILQARQVTGLRGREAGCPACSGAGYQRLVLEGEPTACELCGREIDVVVITETIVDSPAAIAEATASALAAGRTLIGPLAWAGRDDDQREPRQVIEVVSDPPAGG